VEPKDGLGRNDPVPLTWQDGHASTARAEEQTVNLPARTRTTLAWLLWLAAFGCCATGLLVTLAVTRPLTLAVLAEGAAYAVAFPLGYATIGLVLSLRRPANPIGWLYAAAGLAWSLIIPLEPWVTQQARDQRPLPLAAQVAYVVLQTAWAPAITCGITLPLLLLPDGRLRSRRWRPVVAAAVAAGVVVVVAGILAPEPPEEALFPNPLALDGTAGTIATVVSWVGVALFMAGLVAALVCVVLRFRAAHGVQRQQLRWVAAGAGAMVVTIWVLLPVALSGVAPAVPVVLFPLALLCVPVSVAVAMLRYHLWDLDRLVSRTVTYAVVTALLAVPYLLILPAVTRLADDAGDLAVAAATLAAAAAFAPLRRRVQDLVDRRFNRRRYDAAGTVAAFATRLRDQVDLDALEGELLAVVDQTVQPSRTSLWLRPPATPRPQPGPLARADAAMAQPGARR
jgi:hypothetical protein